jgi:hypothetical protein
MSSLRQDRQRRTEQSVQPAPGSGEIGVPYRGIIIGVILSLFGALASRGSCIYQTLPLIDDGIIGLCRIGILGILVVQLANLLARKFRLWRPFGNGDMVAIYITSFAGAAIPHFLSMQIPAIASLWRSAYEKPSSFQPFFDMASNLAALKDDEASMGYWIGDASVPWKAWLPIIFFYTVLMLVIVFTFMCLGVLVRRRWLEHERFTCQGVMPVATVIGPGESRDLAGVVKNKLMWAAAGVIFLIVVLEYVKGKWAPGLPFWTVGQRYGFMSASIMSIRSSLGPEGQRAWDPAFGFGFPSFTLLGMSYFMPTNVLFSAWFLSLFKYLINALLFTVGWVPRPGIGIGTYHYSALIGAYMVLGAGFIWIGRHEFKEVIQRALGRKSAAEVDDTNQGMSYRTALIGLLAGIVVLTLVYVVVFKGSVLWSLVYVLILAFTALSASYLRITVSYPMALQHTHVLLGNHILVPMFGADALGQGSVLSFGFLDHLGVSGVGSSAMWYLEGVKLCEHYNLKRRSIPWLIMIGFGVAFVFTFAIFLGAIYDVGGGRVALAGWGTSYWNNTLPRVLPFNRIEPTLGMLTWMVGGGLVTALFTWANVRFFWWPLHPAGILMALTYDQLFKWWLAFFVAWLVKVLGQRWGGAKGINFFKPIFIGIVIGDVLGIVTTYVVDIISIALR